MRSSKVDHTNKTEKHTGVGFLGHLLTLPTFANNTKIKGRYVVSAIGRSVKGCVGILLIPYIRGLPDVVGTDLL